MTHRKTGAESMQLSERLAQLDTEHPSSAAIRVTTRSLIEGLCVTGVRFVIVGTTAAYLLGVDCAPVDLDVAPDPSIDNLQRLSAHVTALTATFSTDIAELARTTGRAEWQLTATLGLDLVFAAAGIGAYTKLLENSEAHRLNANFFVNVLSIEAVAYSKRCADRAKDAKFFP